MARLELEGLGLLPGEGLVGEVTVLGGLGVDGLGKVKQLDDDTGTEVEVVPDDLDQLVGALGRGAVALDEDGKGLGNTDGVRELDKAAAGKIGVDKGLGDPASNVSGRAVDLGVVLAGEGTTAVGTPAAVGVDNDLTASKTGITLRTANDEAARGLDVIDGAVIQKVGRNDLLDDLLPELLTEVLGGDVVAVLGRDDNGIHTQRLDSAVVVGILNGDLGLGVRTDPWEGSIETSLLHGLVQLVGKQNGQWQELRGLVGGIAKHDTLVTGTELLESLLIVKTLGNIGGLLLNSDQDIAGLVVEALRRVIVTDILDGGTDDLLVVELGLGSDFTEDHDHT